MRAFLFLLLVLAIFGVIMMVSKRLQSMGRSTPTTPKDQDSAETVQCVECGAYLPRRHAVMGEKGPRCPEHNQS